MKAKAWILSLVTYVVVSVGLIILFDWIWPDNRVWTTIIPLIVGGLITHFVRKLFDFIFDYFNRDKSEPVLATSIKVDDSSRRFLAYGASNGEVLQAGNFKGTGGGFSVDGPYQGASQRFQKPRVIIFCMSE